MNYDSRRAILASFAILLFGLAMGGLYYLLHGINDDFGWGVAVGGIVSIGACFLASRNLRESP